MSGQRLHEVLTAYRIGDPHGAYPIFSAEGSRIAPGRWNTSSSPMIYAAQHYSTAMLEKLVHGSGSIPPNQHFVEIMLPNGLSYEVVEEYTLPGWHEPASAIARSFGEAWHGELRSVLLFVPSVVARMERNILINPDHADFARITHGLHRPVWWDTRLFS